jgi:hypothetical protein
MSGEPNLSKLPLTPSEKQIFRKIFRKNLTIPNLYTTFIVHTDYDMGQEL